MDGCSERKTIIQYALVYRAIAQEETGLVVAVCHTLRYMVTFHQVKQIVADAGLAKKAIPFFCFTSFVMTPVLWPGWRTMRVAKFRLSAD